MTHCAPALARSLLACFSCSLSLRCRSPLSAQRRRDPLNPLEIDQLRDAMLDPDERLKLYVKFSRDRMTKLEQMRSDPKTTDRARQTHDMLEDFLGVYDELNDNIDMYVGRKDDIRKPLKVIIEADTEFQSKLRALKNAANTNAAEVEPVRIPADRRPRHRRLQRRRSPQDPRRSRGVHEASRRRNRATRSAANLFTTGHPRVSPVSPVVSS